MKTKKTKTLLLAIFLLLLGYVSGSAIGNIFITQFITGKSNKILLLYRPAYEYKYILNLLNNSNEYKRLAGYYSLLENRRIDSDFLIERYKREEKRYIKRSIIWLLGYSKNKKDVIEYISNIYPYSPGKIKKEILRTMKRLNLQYFNNFVKSKKIDKKYINDL